MTSGFAELKSADGRVCENSVHLSIALIKPFMYDILDEHSQFFRPILGG